MKIEYVIGIFLVMLTATGILVYRGGIGGDVIFTLNNIEECNTVFWNKTKNVWGNCTVYHPGNKSTVTYPCYNHTDIIQFNKTTCDVVGYEINNKTNISFKEFGLCSYKFIKKPGIIVECDSKHDGNADGICQSGESCVKYIFAKDDLIVEYKNTDLNYSTKKESFTRAEKIKLKVT